MSCLQLSTVSERLLTSDNFVGCNIKYLYLPKQQCIVLLAQAVKANSNLRQKPANQTANGSSQISLDK